MSKRGRVHPAVAVTAILCLTAIVISAQMHSGTDTSLKIVVAGIIGAIAGIKVRKILPVT